MSASIAHAEAYTYISQWGSTVRGPDQYSNPIGAAFNSAGDVYVADNWNNRIQKFDSNVTFISTFGSYGSGNGQFNWPVMLLLIFWAMFMFPMKEIIAFRSLQFRIQLWQYKNQHLQQSIPL